MALQSFVTILNDSNFVNDLSYLLQEIQESSEVIVNNDKWKQEA